MFCRKCGKQIPDDSDFCPYCGNKVMMTNMSEEEKIKTTVDDNNSCFLGNQFEGENKSDTFDIVPEKAKEDMPQSNQQDYFGIANDNEVKDDESSSGISGCLGFVCLVFITAMSKACGKAVVSNGEDSFMWLVVALAGIVSGLVASAIPIWVTSKYKMCSSNIRVVIAVVFGALGLWGGIITALPIAIVLSVFLAFFGKKSVERNKRP